ncbi:MAG: cell division protein FtsH, partial [Gemmatimonadales bacterium]
MPDDKVSGKRAAPQGQPTKDAPASGRGGPSPAALGRNRAFLWVLLLTLAVIWIWRPFAPDGEWQSIPYSEFRSLVDEGEVERVRVKGSEIRGELRGEVERSFPEFDEPVTFDRLVTHVPSFGDDQILMRLEAQGVEVRTEPESDFAWWLILVYLLPVVLIIFLFLFLYRGMQSQGQKMMSIGK